MSLWRPTVALHGSLDSFTIPEVLRLLASTNKSGYLALTGDRGNGGTWLDDGHLIGGRADTAQGEAELVDILFELLRFEVGEFSFEEDRDCTTPSEPVDVDALVGAAETMLAEFRRLEKVVPSFDHSVDLVETLPSEKVEINEGLWQSVVAAGKVGTVREVGTLRDLGDLELLRAMRDLIEADLAVLNEPSEPVEEEIVQEVQEIDDHMAEPKWKDSDEVEADANLASPFDSVAAGDADSTSEVDAANAWSVPESGADEEPIFSSPFDELAEPVADDSESHPLETVVYEGATAFDSGLPPANDGAWGPGLVAPPVPDDGEAERSAEPVAVMDESTAAADMARQLANLSPEAAKAVAAAADASNDEEREAAMDALREANVPPQSVAEFLGVADD
jgi:hypothetical protein